MKVLLVRPPEPQMSRFYNKGESLGLGYITSILRENGHEVEILDCVLFDWDQDMAVREIRSREFSVLGLTVFAVAVEDAAKLVGALRAEGCDAHVTLGGHFPSFRAREVLEEFSQFDSVVKFEGEFAFLDLVNAVSRRETLSTIAGLFYREGAKVVANAPRPPITDLDSLPLPARDMLPYSLRWERDAYTCTSRGCWAKCTYCSIGPFSRTSGSPAWRARSPKNVVDELEHLLRAFDPPAIGVVDADFVGPGKLGRRRAFEIADEIRKRHLDLNLGVYTRVDEVDLELFTRLKSAGMTTVYLGIESGVQSALDRWNKRTTTEQNYRALEICSRLGISVEAGFMLYDPYTTLDEISQNLIFLSETGVFDFPSLLARMEVRAGMPMEEQLRTEGRLSGSYRASDYQMIDPKAELFHSGVCTALEPLATVYLRLRDLKHQKGVDGKSVDLAHRRLNQRALKIAADLADALSYSDDSKTEEVRTAVQSAVSSSQQEADRLWRFAVFLEQASTVIDSQGITLAPIDSQRLSVAG